MLLYQVETGGSLSFCEAAWSLSSVLLLNLAESRFKVRSPPCLPHIQLYLIFLPASLLALLYLVLANCLLPAPTDLVLPPFLTLSLPYYIKSSLPASLLPLLFMILPPCSGRLLPAPPPVLVLLPPLPPPPLLPGPPPSPGALSWLWSS